MKLKNSNCKVRQPNTVEHTIFIPHSNKNTDSLIDELTQHFDQVTVREESCPNEKSDYDCIKGSEITAIRIKPTKDQILGDTSLILNIVRPSKRNDDRPVLRSVRDDITYCDRP